MLRTKKMSNLSVAHNSNETFSTWDCPSLHLVKQSTDYLRTKPHLSYFIHLRLACANDI